MVLEYCRESQQVLEIYWRMGRARAQQVLKNGSWSLPIFVGRSCFDSSKQFRGDFKPFSSDFGRFWAILGGFERFCAGSECFPARLIMRRVSARGEGQGMGQPAQQVLEYLLVWLGPASIGEIYGIFWFSLSGTARRKGEFEGRAVSA